jgi:hypothetical protein
MFDFKSEEDKQKFLDTFFKKQDKTILDSFVSLMANIEDKKETAPTIQQRLAMLEKAVTELAIKQILMDEEDLQ